MRTLRFIFVFLVLIGSIACQQCDNIANEQRFDCYPDYNASQGECIKRGCCWRPPSNDSRHDSSNINVPYCYFPSDFPNYEISSFSRDQNTLVYNLTKAKPTFRPNEILNLQLKITFDTKRRLRVQIYDPNDQRYEVPLININRPYQEQPDTIDDNDYQIFVNKSPFSLKIFRKTNGENLFDSSVAPLIFADQYIQFSTSLPSKYIYGLGEHRDSLLHDVNWKQFTFWTRDVSPTLNTNLYGVHPFYLNLENDGNANGLFFVNSNGMDVNLQPYPAITFITIGGIIDFYFYLGPKPQEVIIQHTDVIGKPLMPPYFTLGFHLCRWRYDNDTKLMEVIKRTRETQIPYDTQWTDIDGMHLKMDWTYDTSNFSRLPAIVQDLHDNGQHYINIIDPAIATIKGYAPYEEGLQNEVFIKSSTSDDPVVGIVWPGNTVFPDFTNPNTTFWWTKQASAFHDQISFDGIWIDMNEPSNFVDGSINGCITDKYNMPPYVPKVMGFVLFSRTLCPSNRQYISNHYNLHNMYGHFEAMATNNALRLIKPNKRPFVLTRSSFAGTGQFSAHWSGDNRATWEDLYYSIPVMLEFNMFGVTMVGSDICGFMSDTTEELCIRWMQLGSFYPFMRNHNDGGSKDQDPGVFSKKAQLIMKEAVKIRYNLLPYLYTAYYKSHVFGHAIVKPLFFEYPTDSNTVTIDRQFLYGSSILITPVLEPSASTVKGYFPADPWYDYYTGAQVNASSEYVTLDAPLEKINVHLRGGHIIPTQIPEVTTTASRKNPFGLLVALNYNSEGSFANGSLFWDDGESLDSIEKSNYNSFEFAVKNDNLSIVKTQSGFNGTMILSNVKVFGLKFVPKNVTINSQPYANFTFDDNYMVLNIQYFYIDLLQYETLSIAWS